jgi:hypothetical protein
MDRETVVARLTTIIEKENHNLQSIPVEYEWWDNNVIKLNIRDNNALLKYVKENLK